MSLINNIETSSANQPVLATVKHRNGTAQLKTETSSGAAWLRTYLHPPASLENGRPGFCGFPDRNSAPTTQLHCRGQLEDALTQADTGTPAQKFLQLLMWGLNTQNASFQYAPSSDTPVLSAELTSTNSTYDVIGNAVKDISKLRRTYGSYTIYQDETAFSNRGTITVGSFRPDIVRIQTATALRALLDEVERRAGAPRPKFREHITRMLKGAKVEAGFEDLGASINSTAYILVDRMPRNASDVQNLDSKSYTGMLRDGAFVISRLAEDVNLYEPFLAEAINVVEITSGNVYTVSASPDWVTDQFMMTWVFYENLTTTSGEITNSGNHIFQKWYNGFEIAPTTRSSLLPFMDACAMEDEMALKLANNLMHGCPSADVAATNSLATLLMTALNAAPKVIEWISNIFKKPTPPAPAPVAPTIVETVAPAPKAVRLGRGMTQQPNGMVTMSTARVRRRIRQNAAAAKPPAPPQKAPLNKKQRRILAQAKTSGTSLKNYMKLPSGSRP